MGKYLDIAKRAQAKLKQAQKDCLMPELTTDPTEGPIIAVEIRSNVLDAHIWLTLDDSFKADDGLAVIEELPPRAWVAQEIPDGSNLKAIKICSAVLQDHLWLILDRSFEPKDGLAIYYPEELATIATKSPEELREIHKVKLKFPRCRVIQEGAEGFR